MIEGDAARRREVRQFVAAMAAAGVAFTAAATQGTREWVVIATAFVGGGLGTIAWLAWLLNSAKVADAPDGVGHLEGDGEVRESPHPRPSLLARLDRVGREYEHGMDVLGKVLVPTAAIVAAALVSLVAVLVR
ncbi:MAG: hypothetical protein JWM89_1821 [Acidimicrobiales bacterium]|nr:hypothetical protein [Acidimicrobiales bacterium]